MSYCINQDDRPVTVRLKTGTNVRVRGGNKSAIVEGMFSLINEDGIVEFACPVKNLDCVYSLDKQGETK